MQRQPIGAGMGLGARGGCGTDSRHQTSEISGRKYGSAKRKVEQRRDRADRIDRKSWRGCWGSVSCPWNARREPLSFAAALGRRSLLEFPMRSPPLNRITPAFLSIAFCCAPAIAEVTDPAADK